MGFRYLEVILKIVFKMGNFRGIIGKGLSGLKYDLV